MAWYSPNTWFCGEDLDDGLSLEDADAQDQIVRTQYDYVEYEWCNHETGEEVGEWAIQVWNQKHHWWQR